MKNIFRWLFEPKDARPKSNEEIKMPVAQDNTMPVAQDNTMPVAQDNTKKYFDLGMAAYRDAQPKYKGPDSLKHPTMDESKLRKAYEMFSKVVKLDPDHVDALIMRADCVHELFDNNLYETGLADAEKAVNLAPHNPTAHQVYGGLAGWIYYERGDEEKGKRTRIDHFKKALELDPNYRTDFGTRTGYGRTTNKDFRDELKSAENSLKVFLLEQQLEQQPEQHTNTSATTPLPKFDPVTTKSPQEAVRVVFEAALPATPVLPEAKIRLDFHREYFDLETERKLIEGSEPEVRQVILEVVENLTYRSGFQYFEIMVDSRDKSVVIAAHFIRLVVAIRLWRSSDKIFTTG